MDTGTSWRALAERRLEDNIGLIEQINAAEARIAALEAALRDIKNATGVTAKCSLASQAWINRRCEAALTSEETKGDADG